MENFILRNATINDIDEIMTVERESFETGIQESRETFLTRIENCPQLFLLFVCMENQEICGYICGEWFLSVPGKAEELRLNHVPEKIADDKKKILYLSSFAIKQKFRGCGNGKILWNKSIEYFSNQVVPNPEKLILLVNSKWTKAERIYQKSGFSKINTFKDFFPDENCGSKDGFLYEKLR